MLDWVWTFPGRQPALTASSDQSGMAILWQRNASGTFAVAKAWSPGGQGLGLAVSPDKKTIVTGAAAHGAAGFVFLAL